MAEVEQAEHVDAATKVDTSDAKALRQSVIDGKCTLRQIRKRYGGETLDAVGRLFVESAEKHSDAENDGSVDLGATSMGIAPFKAAVQKLVTMTDEELDG